MTENFEEGKSFINVMRREAEASRPDILIFLDPSTALRVTESGLAS